MYFAWTSPSSLGASFFPSIAVAQPFPFLLPEAQVFTPRFTCTSVSISFSQFAGMLVLAGFPRFPVLGHGSPLF
jgi:hypothetical protein